jgi:hypothetical protein
MTISEINSPRACCLASSFFFLSCLIVDHLLCPDGARAAAEKRLQAVERRLSRDAILLEDISALMG